MFLTEHHITHPEKRSKSFTAAVSTYRVLYLLSMKVTIATVCLALATSVAASVSTREQKPIIVSYPHDTPDGVIAEAKAIILKAVSRSDSFNTLTNQYRAA